jgi:adenosylcobinamide kinase/adenosylcobinamide-phosphate guanylyltransferase
MAKELVLILGGARSGKSSHAQSLALELAGPRVLYLATAEGRDDEMRARIAAHRADRPAGWRTLEAPLLSGLPCGPAVEDAQVVLLDCMTLLATNAIFAGAGGEGSGEPSAAEAEAAVAREVEALLKAYRASGASWIVVSNEVGMGLVPPYPLGRSYRDALGRANQAVAAAADRVILMVAGLPLKVK